MEALPAVSIFTLWCRGWRGQGIEFIQYGWLEGLGHLLQRLGIIQLPQIHTVFAKNPFSELFYFWGGFTLFPRCYHFVNVADDGESDLESSLVIGWNGHDTLGGIDHLSCCFIPLADNDCAGFVVSLDSGRIVA